MTPSKTLQLVLILTCVVSMTGCGGGGTTVVQLPPPPATTSTSTTTATSSTGDLTSVDDTVATSDIYDDLDDEIDDTIIDTVEDDTVDDSELTEEERAERRRRLDARIRRIVREMLRKRRLARMGRGLPPFHGRPHGRPPIIIIKVDANGNVIEDSSASTNEDVPDLTATGTTSTSEGTSD